jgi:hypothetical protein
MRLPPLTLIGGPPSSQVRFHEHSVVNWKRVFFESFFESFFDEGDPLSGN